ncbi:MAG: M23 family metallopeptidase [Candidatus Limnocylindria bacterium]
MTLEIEPEPAAPPELAARGGPGRVAFIGEPKPTPVPIDPNQTPLPGPVANAVGQASGPATAPAAAPVGSGALAWPVPAGSISQYFHAGHLAVDIAAPYGSQVVAAQAGVVTSAGWRNNGGGIVVSIDHGNGIVTSYNHLGAPWVSAGQAVSAGQGIGSVGCTGICTGPHVHFAVVVNGVTQNPLRYM